MQSLKNSSVRPWSRCWKILWEVGTVICAPRPWTRPSAPLFRPSFTSKTKQTEQFTSCTSVPNSSQYFSTQCPIIYYTWFTASTLTVKSVFWQTHAIHVFLNTGVRNVGTSSCMVTSRMWRARCLWCWTYASFMSVSEVTLTLILMNTYITLMI